MPLPLLPRTGPMHSKSAIQLHVLIFPSLPHSLTQGKGRYTPTGVADPSGLDGTEPPPGGGGGNNDYVCDIPAPDGWPGGLPGPEPLSSESFQERVEGMRGW